jgi:hypothetical protein
VIAFPKLTLRAPKSAWTQNADGVWTWHPQPGGVTHIYGPLGDLAREMGVFHEAGHAVAALSAGLGVDGIQTTPGQPESLFETGITGSSNWKGFAACYAAGERAANRWLRETGQWTPERAWSVERGALDDRAEAVELAAELGVPFDVPAHPRGGWTQVCSWADARLNAHWNSVTAVAEVLLAEGSLDAAAVARVAGLPNPSA